MLVGLLSVILCTLLDIKFWDGHKSFSLLRRVGDDLLESRQFFITFIRSFLLHISYLLTSCVLLKCWRCKQTCDKEKDK